MLEVIPGRIGGDKDRAQKFSGMIIDEIFEELAGLQGPIWPVAATGELGAELGAVLQPAGA